MSGEQSATTAAIGCGYQFRRMTISRSFTFGDAISALDRVDRYARHRCEGSGRGGGVAFYSRVHGVPWGADGALPGFSSFVVRISPSKACEDLANKALCSVRARAEPGDGGDSLSLPVAAARLHSALPGGWSC